MTRAEVHALVTGHGFGADAADCAEFCSSEHRFAARAAALVDGTTYLAGAAAGQTHTLDGGAALGCAEQVGPPPPGGGVGGRGGAGPGGGAHLDDARRALRRAVVRPVEGAARKERGARAREPLPRAARGARRGEQKRARHAVALRRPARWTRRVRLVRGEGRGVSD